MEPAATANSGLQSQFDRLPAVLLARILQAVPQQERLASCATVCTSWAAAAAVATVEVDLSKVPRQATSDFQPWLKQHAGQLLSLRLTVEGRCQPKMALPSGQLQQLSRLDLAGLQLQLDTPKPGSRSTRRSSSSTAAAPVMPKLQQFKLQDCQLGRNTQTQLAQLSGITRPKLVGTVPELGKLEAMLQGLPNLAHLSLARDETPAERIPALPPASLTALTVDLDKFEPFMERRLGDSLSRLVCLQKLKLAHAVLSPVALASLSRLTRLQLYRCGLRQTGDDSSSQDSSDDSSEDSESETDAASGAAALLAAIGGMRQLQHLAIDGDLSEPLEYSVEPEDCAALTASSQLTHLQICGRDSHSEWPLPATAVQHMFPAGRQLPQMQELVLSCARAPYVRITTAEMHSIFSACPALRHLYISGAAAEGVDVSVLLQLPSTCASLALGGHGVGDEKWLRS